MKNPNRRNLLLVFAAVLLALADVLPPGVVLWK
jgi:hypothetical protein